MIPSVCSTVQFCRSQYFFPGPAAAQRNAKPRTALIPPFAHHQIALYHALARISFQEHAVGHLVALALLKISDEIVTDDPSLPADHIDKRDRPRRLPNRRVKNVVVGDQNMIREDIAHILNIPGFSLPVAVALDRRVEIPHAVIAYDRAVSISRYMKGVLAFRLRCTYAADIETIDYPVGPRNRKCDCICRLDLHGAPLLRPQPNWLLSPARCLQPQSPDIVCAVRDDDFVPRTRIVDRRRERCNRRHHHTT